MPRLPIINICEQQSKSFYTYDYRRMWQSLKNQNIYRNPKTVLRIMKKYNLLSELSCYRKWRHMGQQLHKYENLYNHQFHVEIRMTMLWQRISSQVSKWSVFAATNRLYSPKTTRWLTDTSTFTIMSAFNTKQEWRR